MGLRASKALKDRARSTFTVAFFAILLALTLLLAAGVEAQEPSMEQTATQIGESTIPATKPEKTTVQVDETKASNSANKEGTVAAAQETPSAEPRQAVQQDGQQAQAATDDEADTQITARAPAEVENASAQIIDSADPDSIVNQVVVSDVDCTVQEGATIVVQDNDGTRVRLTDGVNVNITSPENRIVAQGTIDGNLGDDADEPIAPGNDSNFGRPNDDQYTEVAEIIDATGITCDRDDDNGGNNGNAANNNDDNNLNCDALLRRFRGASGGQYLDVNVSNQILICLAQEVNQDTAADGDLPDTGGPSLIGIAIFGVVSALAGLSLVRGSRRED